MEPSPPRESLLEMDTILKRPKRLKESGINHREGAVLNIVGLLSENLFS